MVLLRQMRSFNTIESTRHKLRICHQYEKQIKCISSQLSYSHTKFLTHPILIIVCTLTFLTKKDF